MAAARRRRGIRGPLRTGLGKEEDALWLKRKATGLLRQALIAVGIFGLVIFVSTTRPPYAPLVERAVKYAATKDYSYDDVASWIVGLREVDFPDSWTEVREVFLGWWNRSQQPPEDDSGSWGLLVPASGPITSGFGWRIHPLYDELRYHTGIDIGAVEGSDVIAVRAGEVADVTEDETWGKHVLITHESDMQSFYAHLAEARVAKGETVSRGQVIGTVGRTGKVASAHLHFELREKGEPVDPEPLIRAAGGGT
jgi:murein DD-endopeptidase MepM/ murein hydrolase activator NlpD